MGRISYVKPPSKRAIVVPILLFIAFIVAVTSLEWSARGLPTILNTPPTWFYDFGFYGESTLSHGELSYSFQPSLVLTELGNMLHFKTTATNVGNGTAAYLFGYGEPEVYVYSLGGAHVSTFAKSMVGPQVAYEVPLSPGGRHSEEWTWGITSTVWPPLVPGIYWVSAQVHVDDFRTTLETSRMLMIVLF